MLTAALALKSAPLNPPVTASRPFSTSIVKGPPLVLKKVRVPSTALPANSIPAAAKVAFLVASAASTSAAVSVRSVAVDVKRVTGTAVAPPTLNVILYVSPAADATPSFQVPLLAVLASVSPSVTLLPSVLPKSKPTSLRSMNPPVNRAGVESTLFVWSFRK